MQILPEMMTDELQELTHYGVKGVKWGSRKNTTGVISRKDAKWANRVHKTKFQLEVHNAMARELNNGPIDRVNNKPKYKNLDLNNPKNQKLNNEYLLEMAELTDASLKKHANALAGTSPSGQYGLKMKWDSEGTPVWEIVDAD